MTLVCTNCDNDSLVEYIDDEMWCSPCREAVKTHDIGTFELRRIMLKGDVYGN